MVAAYTGDFGSRLTIIFAVSAEIISVFFVVAYWYLLIWYLYQRSS
jgi:hypothetical protein